MKTPAEIWDEGVEAAFQSFANTVGLKISDCWQEIDLLTGGENPYAKADWPEYRKARERVISAAKDVVDGGDISELRDAVRALRVLEEQ